MSNSNVNPSEWSVETLMEWDREHGDNNGEVSEEEFMAAAAEMSGQKVDETTARAWFAQMVDDSGLNDEGEFDFESDGINFSGLVDADTSEGSPGALIIENFETQQTVMNRKVREENELPLTDPSAFAEMDTNGDNTVEFEEYRDFVRFRMPGGENFTDEDIESQFLMLAGAESDVDAKDFTLDEEMFNRGPADNIEDGEAKSNADDVSYIEIFQNYGESLKKAPLSEQDSVLASIQELMQQLLEQAQNDAVDEFQY